VTISNALIFHVSNDGHRTVYVDKVDVLVGSQLFEPFRSRSDPPPP
jgi:hypothetical protein